MNWNKNNSVTKQPVEAAEVPEQAVIRVGHRNRYNQKDNFFSAILFTSEFVGLFVDATSKAL